MELCVHFQSCKTRSIELDYIDYISGQSECPYEVDNHEVENPAVDNSEVDKPKIDNPEVDNPVFVSPYQCNVPGLCKVSHKHNINSDRK